MNERESLSSALRQIGAAVTAVAEGARAVLESAADAIEAEAETPAPKRSTQGRPARKPASRTPRSTRGRRSSA